MQGGAQLLAVGRRAARLREGGSKGGDAARTRARKHWRHGGGRARADRRARNGRRTGAARPWRRSCGRGALAAETEGAGCGGAEDASTQGLDATEPRRDARAPRAQRPNGDDARRPTDRRSRARRPSASSAHRPASPLAIGC